MRVYLKYEQKEPTQVRTDRGGEKKRIKRGMILSFDIEMAKFYEKQYPKMFVQVDSPKSQKKKFLEAPKPSITTPNVTGKVETN